LPPSPFPGCPVAHVAVPTNVSAWIDDYLDYLFDVMNDLPKIVAEWDSWDDLEQLDFVVEWDIKRDRLLQLKNWDSQGLFAAALQDRYGELLDLLERQQPILDKLLAE
jgi:hypothetical protein